MSIQTMTDETSAVVTRQGAPSLTTGARTITTVWSGRVRLQPLSGAEQAKYSRDTEVVNAKAYIAGSTPILSGDTLSVGSTAYIVRAVRDINLLGRLTTLELERQR